MRTQRRGKTRTKNGGAVSSSPITVTCQAIRLSEAVGQCAGAMSLSGVCRLGVADGLPAVRVRVKARLLADWFRAAVRSHPTKVKGFVGKVSYCPMAQLAETAAKLSRAEEKRVARVGAEALLMKRLAFEFEREVRLLWIDKAQAGSPKGFGLAFDPNQLFDQIMIGPSKSSAAVKEVRRELVAMKVEDRLITESKVWAPPAIQAVIEHRELQANAQASAQEVPHRGADGTFEDLWVGWYTGLPREVVGAAFGGKASFAHTCQSLCAGGGVRFPAETVPSRVARD